MRLNDDIVLVAEIRAALNKNKELYGKCFCPCVPSAKYSDENNQDYVCPCKNFREGIETGHECHCGLYVK